MANEGEETVSVRRRSSRLSSSGAADAAAPAPAPALAKKASRKRSVADMDGAEGDAKIDAESKNGSSKKVSLAALCKLTDSVWV